MNLDESAVRILTSTDLWGVTIPTWIGAIGGVASAAVAAIAFILSIRNQKGAAVLADGLNRRAGNPGAMDARPQREIVTWRIDHVERGMYLLMNLSWSQKVTLTSATDVSIDGDDAFSLLQDLPVDIPPQGSIPFRIDKTLVSPAVTAIRLEWTEDDGVTRSETLYR